MPEPAASGWVREAGWELPAAILREQLERTFQLANPEDVAELLALADDLRDPEPGTTPTTIGQAPEQHERPAAEPFTGLTHDQVLELDFPSERHLIRDLIPAGAVGTIAGVPETHKSWLAQAIAVRVAAGSGSVLGCDVVGGGGRVGYFWQDDSTREEAERVKLYHRAADAPSGLPLRWFLNEGLALPADLPRLRSTIETLKLDLVVLDSFYNFLPGIDLKDEGAEQVVALLKQTIADTTGCTVLIVDHMPWATDTNRQRLRAYGGVFKNAATRFGIYIDANGKNLSIEARGNNIRGFTKTAAYWDADDLELRLVDKTDHDNKVEERAERVLEILEANPGPHSKTALRKAAGGRAEITDQALEALLARDRVRDMSRTPGTALDGKTFDHGWIASNHAASLGLNTLSPLFGTGADSPAPDPQSDNPVPSPIRGQGRSGTGSESLNLGTARLDTIAAAYSYATAADTNVNTSREIPRAPARGREGLS